MKIKKKFLNIVDELYQHGEIDMVLRDAGVMFAESFVNSDALHAGGDSQPDTVDAAMEALGGLESDEGCIAWEVMGAGGSLQEWASERGLPQSNAKMILIDALMLLARHYGML